MVVGSSPAPVAQLDEAITTRVSLGSGRAGETSLALFRVAQWLEQLTHNQLVAGSSPPGAPHYDSNMDHHI